MSDLKFDFYKIKYNNTRDASQQIRNLVKESTRQSQSDSLSFQSSSDKQDVRKQDVRKQDVRKSAPINNNMQPVTQKPLQKINLDSLLWKSLTE